MALPVGLLSLVGEAALNPKVQGFAVDLAKNVYGRIIPAKGDEADGIKPDDVEASLDDVLLRLDEIPNREEIVATFSVLQADIDRQHQATRYWLMGIAALQTAIIGLLIWKL